MLLNVIYIFKLFWSFITTHKFFYINVDYFSNIQLKCFKNKSKEKSVKALSPSYLPLGTKI